MNGKISNLCQVASVRHYTMTEGASRGLDVIDCDNGKIRFLLNASRALDIMQLYHCGQNVSFVSKNGFVEKDDKFPRRFEGGMLYTCGLDVLGNKEGYEQHGLFHKQSAEILRAECDENGIVVEALIRQTTLFGENLVMRRKYTSAIGDDKVTLEDTLTNCAYTDAQYCLMYHVNVGYPMLDEGAKVVADITSTTPCNDWAEKNINCALTMSDDIAGATETCYFHNLAKPSVSLVNEKIGKTFTLTYSKETLPCFLQWRSMASGDYALGLEPCTTQFSKGIDYKILKSGENAKFFVEFKVSEI